MRVVLVRGKINALRTSYHRKFKKKYLYDATGVIDVQMKYV